MRTRLIFLGNECFPEYIASDSVACHCMFIHSGTAATGRATLSDAMYSYPIRDVRHLGDGQSQASSISSCSYERRNLSVAQG